MKRNLVLTAITAVLCLVTLWFAGCAQQGETTAEGARRHQRVGDLNQQGMMQDVDRMWLTDKPSKLSDRKIP